MTHHNYADKYTLPESYYAAHTVLLDLAYWCNFQPGYDSVTPSAFCTHKAHEDMSEKRYTTVIGQVSNSVDGGVLAPSVPHEIHPTTTPRPNGIDHSSTEGYLATAPESGRLDWPGLGRGTPAHPPGANGQWKDETTLLNSTGAVTKQGSQGEDRANWAANEELAFDDIGDTLTCNSSTAMICQRLHDSGSHSTGDAARFSRIVMPALHKALKECSSVVSTNRDYLKGIERLSQSKKPTMAQRMAIAKADSMASTKPLPKLRETTEATRIRATR